MSSTNALILPSNPPGGTQSSTSAVDTSIQLTNTVLAVVKEVGDMLNGIPYVKSLSGVILQIIKVRDELKVNKKRCGEIIDKVMRMAKKIFEKLAEVAKSDQRDKLAKLEEQLKEHERTLTDVHSALQKHQSRSKFDRLINRGLDELNEHDRRLDELKTDLILDIIFRITMEQASITVPLAQPQTTTERTDTINHLLPPEPHFLVERESQVEQALEILLRQEPTRIAILGGGGFGKTTLARTILRDSKIKEHFQARYFLSCEGMSDANALLLGLGTMLGIKAIPSVMQLLTSIWQILQTSTTLLCLDNFETPWEPFETRTKVEELLESISDIPNLSLMITIRGEQRPSKVAWSTPLLFPLSTLSLEGARKIVVNIANENTINEFTIRLLEAIDGIPLAITLVATLLRDGEDSASLWTRWSMDSTQIINVGDDRQSSLDCSIALSVNSSRMTKNPETRLLLAALSLLPDGFPKGDTLESLQNCLGISSIHTILQTLHTVALVQVNNPDTSRIQMLSPIRLFCQHFLAQEIADALPKIVNHYLDILKAAGYNWENSVNYYKITPEVRNMHTIFQKLFLAEIQKDDLAEFIKALDYLTNWSTYIGYYSKDTIQLALIKTEHNCFLHANCLFSIASLYLWEDDYIHAIEHFKEAANIFQETKAFLLQARALRLLGETLCMMSELDKGEIVLRTSLDLYTAENGIQVTQPQADVKFGLGSLYLARGQLQDAERYLTNALEDYEKTQDLIGQAKATGALAQIHKFCDNLIKAEEFANQALEIAKKANYALGEGASLQGLGQIYLCTDRIMDAHQALEKALLIFKHRKQFTDQLLVVEMLGKVYIQLDQLSAAETLLKPYHSMDSNTINPGYVLTTLGWLHTCGDRLDKAKHYLNAALQLHQKFKNRLGQANVFAHLGIMYLKSGHIDEAREAVKSILSLGRWWRVEMCHFWVLGDICIIEEQFDTAQSLLNFAMYYARKALCTYQQGNIVRSLGVLHIKRGHIDRAIRAFKRALTFHRAAQWVSEQATDLKRLGEVYEMLERTEEAAAAFKEAEELMESVREARQLSE